MKPAYIFLVLLSVGSCIAPIEIETPENLLILTVEGYISTEPGPHQIRLTRSARYGSVFEGSITLEEGANVWIRDANGVSTQLEELEPSFYSTPEEFCAEIGNTYTLNILTRTNENYASLPQKVSRTPDLDSIYISYFERSSDNPLLESSGLDLFAEFKDPGTNDQYMFSFSGIFPWAGCYFIEEKIASVHSDLKFNGKKAFLKSGTIEDNGKRFSEKYFLELSMSTIDGTAYQFYNSIKTQLEISGDIFDPPPSKIIGNIYRLGDLDEPIIGHFGAFHIVNHSMYLQRSILKNPKRTPSVNGSCLSTPGKVIDKPDFWE